MSFTIKCDKCGHTSKWRQRQVRNSQLKGHPIVIETKSEPGDAGYWHALRCTNCGQEVEEI